jgi:hypothetical protein
MGSLFGWAESILAPPAEEGDQQQVRFSVAASLLLATHGGGSE